MAVTQGAGDKDNSGNFDVRNPEIENIHRPRRTDTGKELTTPWL